jgi:hypothetical protein
MGAYILRSMDGNGCLSFCLQYDLVVFVQNYLGLLMVGLVVAYHFITADPKYNA